VEDILAFAPSGASVIVNDRVDVARIAGAAGVHLGQEDLPADDARRILGPDATIGVSTHTAQQALAASKLPVDYIAVGPVFPTTTRKNPSPAVGIEALQAITRSVPKPVVAIGGITLENCGLVYAAGADSVAVIRGLLDAPDVAARVREWLQYNQSWPS
jgi:thiamine-phosphate pyrophosphorylase